MIRGEDFHFARSLALLPAKLSHRRKGPPWFGISRRPGHWLLSARFGRTGIPGMAKTTKKTAAAEAGDRQDFRHLAGRDLPRAEGCQHHPGLLCARCRAFEADPAAPRRSGDRHHGSDHRGRRHCACRRRLAGGQSLRAAAAIERRGQLHQHALADGNLPLSAAGHRDHARRMGGVQSLADAHGPCDAPGARADGGQDHAGDDHRRDAAETVAAAAVLAFDGDQQMAVLLSQRMLGRKKWVEK